MREYWIVDYRARTVDVLVLEGREFVQRGHYGAGSVAPSKSCPALLCPSLTFSRVEKNALKRSTTSIGHLNTAY